MGVVPRCSPSPRNYESAVDSLDGCSSWRWIARFICCVDGVRLWNCAPRLHSVDCHSRHQGHFPIQILVDCRECRRSNAALFSYHLLDPSRNGGGPAGILHSLHRSENFDLLAPRKSTKNNFTVDHYVRWTFDPIRLSHHLCRDLDLPDLDGTNEASDKYRASTRQFYRVSLHWNLSISKTVLGLMVAKYLSSKDGRCFIY